MSNNYLYSYTYTSPNGGGQQKQVVRKVKDLKKYQTYLEVHHRKNNTITRYYESAKKLYAYTNGNINQDTISNYIAHLNKNHKPNTVTSEIQGLNKYLDYLDLSHLHIPIPDWQYIHRDTITTEEIRKIREHAKNHYNTMEYLFLLFITESDCRNHEIAKAEWSWIRGNKIYFQDCKTGNTTGYLSRELLDALDRWKTQRPKPKKGHGKYIFINTQGAYKGERLSEVGWKIRETIKKITKEIIGRSLTPQDLRASVITAEFDNYVNPKLIQRKARHSTLKTTMRYNHIDDKRYEEYINIGTIFTEKPLNNIHKGGYIKDLRTQDITEHMEEDNTSFSFSIYFLDQTPHNLVEKHGIWSWGFSSSLIIVQSLFDFIQDLPHLQISLLTGVIP